MRAFPNFIIKRYKCTCLNINSLIIYKKTFNVWNNNCHLRINYRCPIQSMTDADR